MDRFWSKVDQTGDCWLWTGALISSGYGSFYFNGGSVLAHRFVYELKVGVIPDGMVIDHLCHTRMCVNPDHLRLTSYRGNQLNRAGAQSNSKSGMLGVSWCKKKRKWRAQFSREFLGYFDNADDAAEAVRLKKIHEVRTVQC